MHKWGSQSYYRDTIAIQVTTSNKEKYDMIVHTVIHTEISTC